MRRLPSIRTSVAAASLLGGWLLLASLSFGVETIGYRAQLRSPGGELQFGLALTFREKSLQSAEIINGSERIPVSKFALDADRLTLAFPHYNSEIVAQISSDRKTLLGTWTKRSGNKKTEMPFRAEASIDARATPGDSVSEQARTFAGRWRAKFESSSDPAVAIFETEGDVVQGTILTTTGDYRYLAGEVRQGHLRLATFDGSHAFLFDALVDSEGKLRGNFWSGTSWHETWKAVRDDAAELPDGFEQVHLKQQPDWSKLELHDVDGQPKSLDVENDFGQLTIVNVFGSWCPNCHDEAPYLVTLQKEFGEQGLKIIGLAFEASGEVEQDLSQVKHFVERHSVSYPVFLAGVSDKQKATQALGFVDEVKAFPTSIFVDRAGKVLAIYSGFSGPATGAAHEELKERFKAIIHRQLNIRGESNQ